MYKLIIFPLLFAAASAGYLAAPAHGPVAYAAPVVAAPVVHAAPVVAHAAPAATSYQNLYHPVEHQATYQVPVAAPVVKVAPAPVVKYAAPVVPVVKAYAAPAYGYHG